MNESDYMEYNKGVGMKFLIHEVDTFPSIYEAAFAIKPGTEAYISIEKIQRKSLSTPYAKVPCKEEKEGDYKHIHEFSGSKYTYEGCIFHLLYIVFNFYALRFYQCALFGESMSVISYIIISL